MNTKDNNITPQCDEEQIDQRVIAEADNDSAWDPAVRVDGASLVALAIPSELAARVAFLAAVHRESGMDKWVERVVRERVELEEFAFAEAKRKLAS